MNRLAVARGPEDAADVSDNQKLLDLAEDTVDINAESNMTTDAGAAIPPKEQRLYESSSQIVVPVDAVGKVCHSGSSRGIRPLNTL